MAQKVLIRHHLDGKLLASSEDNQLVLIDKGELAPVSSKLWKFTQEGFVVNQLSGLLLQVEPNSQTVVLGESKDQPCSKWTHTSNGKIHLASDNQMYLCAPKTLHGKVQVRFCDEKVESLKGCFHRMMLSEEENPVSMPVTEIDSPTPQHGYPVPGPQSPTAAIAMQDTFFVHDDEWAALRSSGEFDYIVVGSSFCGFAFAQRILGINPYAKVIVLERGDYFLPQHFKSLPLPFKYTRRGVSETYPWSITSETHNGEYIKWQHGQVPYLGGASVMWNGWCPEPLDADMPGWPKEVTDAIHSHFEDVTKLLNITSASEIFKEAGVIFKEAWVMQRGLEAALDANRTKLATVTRIIPAPLAANVRHLRYNDFQTYSVPGPLLQMLDLQKQKCIDGKGWLMKLATNCVVERIIQERGRATALQTSRGRVDIGNAKLILAMGTLPPTTLMLNSFPNAAFSRLEHVGERYTAHFTSAVIARIPRSSLPYSKDLGQFEKGAMYIAGTDPASGKQYHIQFSATTDARPIRDTADSLQHFPDVVAAPSHEQLMTSKDHIIFDCAALGELDHRNVDNWLRLNKHDDLTSNVDLQVIANKTDNALWDVMDEAVFDVIEKGLSGSDVEYWHPTGDSYSGSWRSARPPADKIRKPALFHEASTMWIGDEDDKKAPVGLDYRPRGVENVYITGASLSPTGGSWNPTASMVALALHLADTLSDTK